MQTIKVIRGSGVLLWMVMEGNIEERWMGGRREGKERRRMGDVLGRKGLVVLQLLDP